MWPYNHCEWKTVTYGISEVKKRAKDKMKNNLILCASAIPSIILILALLYTVIG